MQSEFKYADLLDDDVFKLVFGRESSKDVMIEFLNQVIPDTRELLTDRVTLIFLDLTKFNKCAAELSGDVLEGMYFCFKNMATLAERPEVLEHNVFRKIFEVSELINMDEVTRSKVIEKMITERDLRNQMEYALNEAITEGHAKGLAKGLAEGHAEGLAEGLAEAARRMLAAGMTVESVAEILQIPEEKIKEML